MSADESSYKFIVHILYNVYKLNVIINLYTNYSNNVCRIIGQMDFIEFLVVLALIHLRTGC